MSSPLPDANALCEQLWEQSTVYSPTALKGQVAVVSGGGTGIGRAIALLFARLGASVAICGRKAEKLTPVVDFATRKGARVIAATADIRQPDQIAALFTRAESELGPIDILVNNAGGQFPQAAIDFTPRGWNAVIDNNLNGTWYMMQAAARYWRERARPGAIVNIVTVIDRGMPGVAHTTAARAGVIYLSKTVAVEWAPLKIRIICIAPGVIATEGMAVYPPEAVKEFARANPMLRGGEPRDIAEACVYLAAPSSKFVTGDVLTVDGGGRLWGELWTNGKPDYFKP